VIIRLRLRPAAQYANSWSEAVGVMQIQSNDSINRMIKLFLFVCIALFHMGRLAGAEAPGATGDVPTAALTSRDSSAPASATAPSAPPNDTRQPKRLLRSESFFGLHFDFHAGRDCTEIGKNTTREMVQNLVNRVRPDYLQIDCKGHPGLSSYPTRVGNRAPGFVGDPLKVWRDVTAESGVALYMHYSGVWDSEAIRLHPEWGAVNADGKTNPNATSFFSEYADKLLIPQLRELAGDYEVDGAWVDGECWASVPDYGEKAIAAFKAKTGITDVPRKPGDPHWYDFLQFNREAFRQYLRHYIAEVKRTNPQMQLCSNWAFTDHMPEPVSAPVDWLSGDYSPEDSVNSARFSARYLVRQGKPWDLMAWSFTRQTGPGGRRLKSAPQLQREAAVVLSLGGGFQAYFKQKRDGSIYEEEVPLMADLAAFCRARQSVCQRAVPIPQVALLYSTAAHYRAMNGLFPRDLTRMRGVLQALLESQYVVEVVGEHHLSNRAKEYGLIVLPETDYLEPEFKETLLKYVRDGGSLLLVGPRAAALFASELGLKLESPQNTTSLWLEWDGKLTPVKGLQRDINASETAKPHGKIHAANDLATAHKPAASIWKFGQGTIAATWFDFGRGYVEAKSDVARGFLADLAKQLSPAPIVEVEGSHDVDVVVSRLDNRITVNLVNTAGPHAEQPIFDTIPPVGPLQVKVRHDRAPKRVVLEPGGQQLRFEHHNGFVRFTVPQLAIHSIAVLEP